MLDLGVMSCCNRYTVLCVDDEKEFLDYLSAILKLYFLEVYAVLSVKEAYEIIEDHPIDLIITDVYMPKINGIDFIQKIRSERSAISVIFLTACFEKDFLHAAIPLGLDAYLTKPVTLEKLFATLRRSIEIMENRSSKTYALKGGVSFDLIDEVVYTTASRKIIDLTPKELALLSLLVKNQHLILSKSVIEEYLWEFESIANSSVKTLIKKLRTKIGESAIVTHSTIGYSIVLEEKAS
ncbi:response regulator transcription factor [Sulfurospirillum barnesii]|uniref:Response regulator with CheY-like receiver domain and winged-helix DNA-binding domain n=1 Tax=Sulfurospirillum barnesii (strain ATCC 700032 / DSM 10660 / SES-3) TaxID=760154 RepID=I3XWM3_SULBS|nr:response regulator transcription factor [Sulfurospirillum barnesii]AFL68347.1 response regulator with CheY-like receiver domain and winged-helix DNA-binding domain [Sulfurospirillum barnesii SES-3]